MRVPTVRKIAPGVIATLVRALPTGPKSGAPRVLLKSS